MGFKGLIEQEILSFCIEVDLHLSDAIVETVNRQIQTMLRHTEKVGAQSKTKVPALVRERDLRYRIEIEMLPRSGILRVADEYLAALSEDGKSTGTPKTFLERQGRGIHLYFGRSRTPHPLRPLQTFLGPQHTFQAAFPGTSSPLGGSA